MSACFLPPIFDGIISSNIIVAQAYTTDITPKENAHLGRARKWHDLPSFSEDNFSHSDGMIVFQMGGVGPIWGQLGA